MPDHSRILDEHKIDLHETTRLLGTNDRPTHLSTAIRAITRGIRAQTGERVYLEALRIGGRWVTSREAIARFTACLTSAALGEVPGPAAPPIRTTRQRRRELERVDRQLDEAGL
jgi:hypothetical protein